MASWQPSFARAPETAVATVALLVVFRSSHSFGMAETPPRTPSVLAASRCTKGFCESSFSVMIGMPSLLLFILSALMSVMGRSVSSSFKSSRMAWMASGLPMVPSALAAASRTS